MKDFAGAVVLFFIMLFAYTKLAGPFPFSVHSVTTTKSDSFTVSGEGKVTVIPDIAIVQVGVTAEGPTVSGVQQEINASMNAVTEAVKKLGVDAKDIRTSRYDISPKYDYTDGRRESDGYEANTSLTIRVRKIDTANSVIDAATAAGANDIGGVTFDVDDKDGAENQARELAVRDAKTKAAAAAKAAGFTLGKVINYSEGRGAAPRPVMYDAAKSLPEAGGGEPTNVEPGSSEVDVTVTLSYEIL